MLFRSDVPQADLTLISGTLYELDTEIFRLALKDIEDDETGMAFSRTHARNAPVTVAGTTFAQTLEILAPYSVRFEDGAYSVRLVGSNNNIFDVASGILVQNQVQVIPTNSAGLVVVTSGSGLSAAQDTKLDELYKLLGLDTGTPMTVTPAGRTAGAISQTFTGDGSTTTTVTRNP